MPQSQPAPSQFALRFDRPAEPAGPAADWPWPLPTAPDHAPHVLELARLETPLGPMMAGATAEGVCLLEFFERRELQTELQDLAQRFNARVVERDNPHLRQLRAELAEYFAGSRQEFTVPLLTPGSAFQQQVWQELRLIPYGHTRSYGQQALALKKPEAVRAVAAANGQNRLAILIPCHRVIGADGKLTGYAGGLWRKQRLLALEQQHRQPAAGQQISLF
ncbi:methylated-DNA--[protein]-cysteine S-methyltransferase [Hymenobacter sp. 15J16-1T3B]|uniref:methylated-DNA--[protein]-cysteine S-methyltransferase n=1 Tax=Hymenobacter sp. 15J16-1T3B TaxID=2886941 RepID=UPI001D126C11|nr:methylated-DNA--[protein]-cysteine S-methyltransferase [Hymenobacter sp. 15J16-1T3B]MCC3157060.1 methylated-DNA--[protein]-cysteine S-methyltransferase [Hymenobacter sp. 15J16-1T3B]